jgi:hypothetical protein
MGALLKFRRRVSFDPIHFSTVRFFFFRIPLSPFRTLRPPGYILTPLTLLLSLFYLLLQVATIVMGLPLESIGAVSPSVGLYFRRYVVSVVTRSYFRGSLLSSFVSFVDCCVNLGRCFHPYIPSIV